LKNLNEKIGELAEALRLVKQKQLEYRQAVSKAKEKSEELCALAKLVLEQPHISIEEYEIDN
jgi:hypothetical protein